MAAPPKRTPGYVFVIAFVLAVALIAIPIVLLRPQPVLGPPILFVRATDVITATPADVAVPADFGPHCSAFRWDGTKRVLEVQADADLTGVQGLVLQNYRPNTSNFLSNDGDFLRARLLVDNASWRLTSPVDESVLANFTRFGGNVLVDGVIHAPGDEWTLPFAYSATTANGPVQVTETIAFVNEGVVRPHIVPAGACA